MIDLPLGWSDYKMPPVRYMLRCYLVFQGCVEPDPPGARRAAGDRRGVQHARAVPTDGGHRLHHSRQTTLLRHRAQAQGHQGPPDLGRLRGGPQTEVPGERPAPAARAGSQDAGGDGARRGEKARPQGGQQGEGGGGEAAPRTPQSGYKLRNSPFR